MGDSKLLAMGSLCLDFIFAEIFMCPLAMLSSTQKKIQNFKSLHSSSRKSVILMGPFQLSIFCDCTKWKCVLPTLSFSGFTTAHASSPPPKLSANSTHLLQSWPASLPYPQIKFCFYLACLISWNPVLPSYLLQAIKSLIVLKSHL